MYKILCIVFLALVASAGTARAQAVSDDSAIRRVLSAQVDDWNRGDIPAFMGGYWHSDSVMFMTKKGPAYGWEPVLEHYKAVYPNKDAMGYLQFSDLTLQRLSPDYYFVIGTFHLHPAKGADQSGHFTLLFRKFDGAWKIVVDHTS
jgi:ketosteroid isomerase-like protein